MKKRLWGIVQKIVVSITAASVVAAYAMPASADGVIVAPGVHIHDGVSFEAWDSDSEFPTDGGSWYLTKDITIAKDGDFRSPDNACVQITKPLNLCLNGHTITFKLTMKNISVNDSNQYATPCSISNTAEFNIYDSDSNKGKIHTGRIDGPVINGYIQLYYPTLLFYRENVNLYGGELSDDADSSAICGKRYNENNPVFTLCGGKITAHRNSFYHALPYNIADVVVKSGDIVGLAQIYDIEMIGGSINNAIHVCHSAKIGGGTVDDIENKEPSITSTSAQSIEVFGDAKICSGKNSIAISAGYYDHICNIYIYENPTIEGKIEALSDTSPQYAKVSPHSPDDINNKYTGETILDVIPYRSSANKDKDFNGYYIVKEVDETTKDKFTTSEEGYVLVYEQENEALRLGKIYNLTLNTNGGTIATPTDYETYTGWIGKELPVPTKLGSTFEGWYSDADFGGDPISEILPSDSGDKVLFAKWSENPPPTHTLTLNLNGGNIDGEESYAEEFTEGDTLSLPEPKREKYTFGGWFANAELNGAAVKADDLDTRGDITLWAKWIPEPGTVTVSVKSENGAAGISSDETAIKNAVLKDSDQEELAQGKDIKIQLVASVLTDGSEGENDRELGCIIGKALDISLYKYIDDAEEKLTSVSEEIPITVDIPQDLRKEERTFYIIRDHDGKREKLADLDNEQNTVAFRTNLFSPYYIAYSDPDPVPPPETETTTTTETEPPVTPPEVTTDPTTTPTVTTDPTTTPTVTTDPTTPTVTTDPTTTPTVTAAPTTTPPVTDPPVTTPPATEPPIVTAAPAQQSPPTLVTDTKPQVKPAETTAETTAVASGNSGTTPQKPNQQGSNDGQMNTGGSSRIKFLVITGCAAAYIFVLLYYTTGTYGMTEERKDKLIASVTAWGKKGGKIRQSLAMTGILLILIYYWSIGQKIVLDKAEHA